MLTKGAATPHEELVLFNNETPVAVRTQRWKYVANTYWRGVLFPYESRGYPQLYDLQADPAESYSVAEANPQVLAQMQARMAKARETFAPFAHKEPPAYFKTLRQSLERQD